MWGFSLGFLQPSLPGSSVGLRIRAEEGGSRQGQVQWRCERRPRQAAFGQSFSSWAPTRSQGQPQVSVEVQGWEEAMHES